jgi:hypothetical protein
MANLWPGLHAGSQAMLVDLPSYISGYVDGEGCFSVSIAPRPRLVVGWEVRPSFAVGQNGDRSEVLRAMQGYFGCGSIRPNRRDKTLKWEVRSLPLLWERVVPHFRQYPLLSSKRLDFDLFENICASMIEERHLSMEALAEIVRLAARMNPSGERRYRPHVILEALEMKA